MTPVIAPMLRNVIAFLDYVNDEILLLFLNLLDNIYLHSYVLQSDIYNLPWLTSILTFKKNLIYFWVCRFFEVKLL